MKVAVLGTGEVARALAQGFAATGHTVTIGTREPARATTVKLLADVGHGANAATTDRAAADAELVVLAVLGTAAETVVRTAGPEHLVGKTLIDVTNPLSFETGAPSLFVGFSDSLGERVQRAAPKAHVVKAFNIVGNAHMFKPDLPGGPPDMYYCGNDAGAKRQVEKILDSFGWPSIDIGGIDGARLLEPLCLLWVRSMMAVGSPNIAFKLLRSGPR
jgi:8-hydroxy-5-deazaflavin:NADPH oxidoreductase